MNPHLRTVAFAFYTLAALLGVPGIFGIIFYSIFQVSRWLTPSPQANAPTKNPDAILMMLSAMTRVIGVISRVIGGAGKVFFHILGIVSLAALATGVGLYFVAGGLEAHRPWARIAAAVFMMLLLAVSLISLLSVPRRRSLLSLMSGTFCGYALWALWNG